MTDATLVKKTEAQIFKVFWVLHLKVWLCIGAVLFLTGLVISLALAGLPGVIHATYMPLYALGALFWSLITGAIHWLISSK